VSVAVNNCLNAPLL